MKGGGWWDWKRTAGCLTTCQLNFHSTLGLAPPYTPVFKSTCSSKSWEFLEFCQENMPPVCGKWVSISLFCKVSYHFSICFHVSKSLLTLLIGCQLVSCSLCPCGFICIVVFNLPSFSTVWGHGAVNVYIQSGTFSQKSEVIFHHLEKLHGCWRPQLWPLHF